MFAKDYIYPRYRALSQMLNYLANILVTQFPAGEGSEGAKIAHEAGYTIQKMCR